MSDDCPKCEGGLPPWLATFADLMSLLMCFFVLLLSFATIDAVRFKKMADSMKDAFGVQREIPATEIVKGTSVIKQEFSPSTIPEPSLINEIRQQTVDEEKENLDVPQKDEGKGEFEVDEQMQQATAEQLKEQLEEKIKDEVKEEAEILKEILKDEITEGLVTVETVETKIIVRIQEKGSFPSGSASLDPGFFEVMDRISQAVADSPGKIVVAGHTDDIPISTTRFRSNWELSSARAVTVLHAMLRNPEIDPQRVMVEGHADSNPLEANDSAENRAKNRRVELIILRGSDQDKGEIINAINPQG
ncbi:MAG: type VI secretion system protein TssL [Sedimenticola sp.]|jgi:chemotaxis protein MotB|nr:MAG: type VI secretion system protein TssL [Sedimenticola sp.]